MTDTVLTVRGRTAPFAHRDQNTLMKVSEPLPNPLARIIAAKLSGQSGDSSYQLVMARVRRRPSRRSKPVVYSIYIVELDRKCRERTVCLCSLVRRANSAYAGRALRPAQGRRHACGRKTACLRRSAALRPDERDRAVPDPQRSRSSRDGGGRRSGEARPSRLLGLKTVSGRRLRSYPGGASPRAGCEPTPSLMNPRRRAAPRDTSTMVPLR